MFLKRPIIGLVVIVLFVSNNPAWCGQAEQVDSLRSEWIKARENFQHELGIAATSQERELLKAKNPDREFASRFLRLAEKLGTNSEAAAEVLVYTTYADRNGSVGDQALNLLARDHVDSRCLELLFNSKPLPDDAAAENLFRAIAGRSRKYEYQGQATKILADLLKDSDPDEAGKLYQVVIKNYGDVKSFEDFGQRLGKQAQRGLFYVDHLVTNKIAPDFEGKDTSGKIIKLSDYRGKIVLVYFCSISCAPCHALYPYWRSLTERMKDQPFILIGINSDPPQKMFEIIQKEKITWPTLLDDYNQPNSINAQWYVQGWPTIFLIDEKGVIRRHWVGSPGDEIIDQQVQELLKKASGD